MSSQANPQHEPTMEEILASIRKIISDDQPEAEKGAAPSPQPPTLRAVEPAPAPEPVPAPQEDVLELTEEMREDTPARETAPHKPATQEDMADVPDGDLAFENIDEPEPRPAKDYNDGLISSRTSHAVGRVLENLDHDPAEGSAGPGGYLDNLFTRAIHESFEPVLERWVADHSDEIMTGLRPLICEWMDDNLPRLIESAVAKEVRARIRR